MCIVGPINCGPPRNKRDFRDGKNARVGRDVFITGDPSVRPFRKRLPPLCGVDTLRKKRAPSNGYLYPVTRNRFRAAEPVNPFSTAVPIWGQTSLISSELSPKRDWGPARVNHLEFFTRVCPQNRTASLKGV